MTAEIIIMNSVGIALAADSAVTLGVEKIYTSAEKLFLLSENAPVGVMVYGNADLINIPWETIIKVFRKKLGNKTFNKLDDYSDRFIKFIKSDPMFTETLQSQFVESLALSYYSYFQDDLLRSQLENELEDKELTEEDIKRVISELTLAEIENTKKFKLLDGIPRRFASVLRSKYQGIIQEARQEIFKNLPIEEKTSEALTNLIYELIMRRRFGAFDSGIVIAGFGEDEIFPTMIEYKMQGIAANEPLYFKLKKEYIGNDSTAYIAPFAQKEMVYTFMEGIDPELREMIVSSIITLFEGASDIIIEKLENDFPESSQKLNENLKTELGEMVKNLITDWDKKRKSGYSDPIMEIVSSLPKDELGAMAESLVNLTKFKRRVSRQQETVGGPIDVAVITKGDGFVWIKRKHYFNPELNPRFIGRYYNKQ